MVRFTEFPSEYLRSVNFPYRPWRHKGF